MNEINQNNNANDQVTPIITSKKLANDIYIMFIVDKIPQIATPQQPDELFSDFLEEFDKNAAYECSSGLSKTLKREYLGKYDLACIPDTYDGCEEDGTLCKESVEEIQNVYFYATNHYHTGLSIVTMIIPSNSYKVTSILDQMSTQHLYYRQQDQSGFISAERFFKEVLSVEIIAEPKAVVCLNNKPQDEIEMVCILACETYQSEYVSYAQSSREMLERTKNNLAQYDFYELYASEKSILFIDDAFTADWKNNIASEISILFICEILLMRIAAITRTNRKIKSHLTNDIKITLREIEELYNEFRATVIFWEINNFKYLLANKVFDHLHTAFQVDSHHEAYKSNHSHLEHLVNIKGGQAAEREGFVMNAIAVALAVFQLLPLIISGGSEEYTLLGSGTTILLFMYILYLIRRSRSKSRKAIK